MYYVLKAVDRKVDADGVVIEYLLQNNEGRQAWYKTEDIKVAIRNGQLIVQNLTLTTDGRLFMNFKKASDMEKDAKLVQEQVIEAQLKNIVKFVAVGYSIDGLVTYSKGEVPCPESLIQKLKDELAEYEDRFKKRNPRNIISFLDETVKSENLHWIKSMDLYVIGSKDQVEMALADVILNQIRLKCDGIISSRVEAAAMFNNTVEEMMTSGYIDFSSGLSIETIKGLVIDKAKPNMFKQLQGSWSKHEDNAKYLDVDFKVLSEQIGSGAKVVGAEAKRIGTSIKKSYDNIDKEEIKKNLASTISSLENTLKIINESETATKAKNAAKQGFKGLLSKITSDKK